MLEAQQTADLRLRQLAGAVTLKRHLLQDRARQVSAVLRHQPLGDVIRELDRQLHRRLFPIIRRKTRAFPHDSAVLAWPRSSATVPAHPRDLTTSHPLAGLPLPSESCPASAAAPPLKPRSGLRGPLP